MTVDTAALRFGRSWKLLSPAADRLWQTSQKASPEESSLSKKHSRKRGRASGFPSGANAGTLPQQTAAVKRLIAEGHAKSAVELAKQAHKNFQNAVSEATLVDAYVARIRSLRERRMEAEAAALLAMVRERYPRCRKRLAGVAALGPGPEPPLENWSSLSTTRRCPVTGVTRSKRPSSAA